MIGSFRKFGRLQSPPSCKRLAGDEAGRENIEISTGMKTEIELES